MPVRAQHRKQTPIAGLCPVPASPKRGIGSVRVMESATGSTRCDLASGSCALPTLRISPSGFNRNRRDGMAARAIQWVLYRVARRDDLVMLFCASRAGYPVALGSLRRDR